MSAHVKAHPIRMAFRANTPLRVIREVGHRYSRWLLKSDSGEETVAWESTDLAKEIERTATPGKSLRQLREMTDMTLAEVGKAVGVAPQRVCDWESGRREISKANARKLAILFGCSPAVFV